MFFTLAQKVNTQYGYFLSKFVTKNFQKTANLVTLTTMDALVSFCCNTFYGSRPRSLNWKQTEYFKSSAMCIATTLIDCSHRKCILLLPLSRPTCYQSYLGVRPFQYDYPLALMSQCAFQFATRGHWIKGKQCHHITVRYKWLNSSK